MTGSWPERHGDNDSGVDDEDSCSIYHPFTLCRATTRVAHDTWEADRTGDNHSAQAKSCTRDTQVGRGGAAPET